VVEDYGTRHEQLIVAYGPRQFVGEIGLLTGQRAFLSAVVRVGGTCCGSRPPTCRASWRKRRP